MMIKSNDQSTTAAELADQRRKYREDYTSRLKTCSHCQYTGTILCIHRDSQMLFSFRCEKCDAAKRQQLSDSLPQWNESAHGHEYEHIKT